MAVTAAQLKSPTGKVEAAFFPGETGGTLDARLAAYIAEGESEAGDVGDWDSQAEYDAAVTSWAYYRAFEAVYLRLIATPSTVSITEEGSTQFTQQQINAFKDQSDNYRTAFDAAIADPDEPVATGVVTQSLSTKVTW